MTPIICCGETLETREVGKKKNGLVDKPRALEGLTVDQVAQAVIAYEPIWAIGTGKTASLMMHKICQHTSAICYLKSLKKRRPNRILYGGSVKPTTLLIA